MGDDRFASEDDVTQAIICVAIAVHKHLGPGLLESIYHECMEIELKAIGVEFQTQLEVPIEYRGQRARGSYRLDLFVAKLVIVEFKAIDQLAPVHKAQIMTYMKLMRARVGLLINFNVAYLKDGIQRFVL